MNGHANKQEMCKYDFKRNILLKISHIFGTVLN